MVRLSWHQAQLLLLWLIHTTNSNADCPEQCVCMWKSGKETTECINRDKKAIPSGIAPSTQVLDLRGNNIRVLHNNVFLQLGITNLQRIYCSYCGIVEIEPKAFSRLTNLIELDLSENAMREIPSEAWKNAKALMRLSLSGNPIKLIRSGAFSHLRFVTTLALSHCDIETVEDGAFEGMEALTEVKLESNKLQYLQGSGLFPRNLNHIEIHDNPFTCDCRLQDFTHWLQRSGVPKPVEPACKTPPRLENRTLSTLKLDELACLPQVEPTALVMDSVAGANVSLRCSVFGLPTASVSWWHSNRLVANGSELHHSWEDQYYSIAEYRTNAHQLISELVVLSIRPEDDGSFFCSAQNPAGVARSNFTIRIVENIEDSSTGGTSGVLQENTADLFIPDKADMFKVEYILAFGAAAVIVLTIIIVLILYLILQCRSQRRKRRAARAAGLHCDSNSGSFMERSTVDFIVPGEMELTSAVRSVSCSSVNNKCNGLKVNNGGLGAASKLNNEDKESGNDGDDEEDYNVVKKYNNQPLHQQPPSYRQPPPYGGCPRNSSNPLVCCPCCGEVTQQMWPFQPPPLQQQQQPLMGPRLCPTRPLNHRPPIMIEHHSNFGFPVHFPRQPFFYPQQWPPLQQPPHQPLQPPLSILKAQQGWVIQSDHEEVKYGAYSDGEAEKGQYNKMRPGRSRSLPRRPASGMLVNSPRGVLPHYVTLSRAATVESTGLQFEHQSIQFRGGGGQQQPQKPPTTTKIAVRYSSQPQLNGILEFPPLMPQQKPPLPPLSTKPQFSSLKLKAEQHQPKYVQPVCQQGSAIENAEYLFPDLPPPPDALLDNGGSSPPSQDLQTNSRCSSLDDLQWVTSAAEMSRLQQLQMSNPGFHTKSQPFKSSTLPTNMIRPTGPTSIMKKQRPLKAATPILASTGPVSGAVRVDLSTADKSIRRRPSECELKLDTSPMRPSIKATHVEERSINNQRHSGISLASSNSKKVMFSGVVSDGESPNEEDDNDQVWVLRDDDEGHQRPILDDGIPVTGVIVAQPRPCQYVQIQKGASAAAGGPYGNSSPIKAAKAAPPPPPPRTTPVNSNMASAAATAQGLRPVNPVLQRPVQLQQFHESPDEGYHEDDQGSEAL